MTETSRGVFVSPGSATNATFIAQDAQLDWTWDLAAVVDAVLGSRDPQGIYDTLHDMRLSMMIPGLMDPTTITFLKQGINLTGPNTTFSGVQRVSIGGTTYYLEFANMLIGAGAISLMGAGPWTAGCWMTGILKQITTTAPTNWTFISPPSGAIMMSSGAGALNVTIEDLSTTTNYTPSVRGIVIGFNNGLFPIPQTGQNTWADVIPTRRGINIRYVVNVESTTGPSLLTIATTPHQANSTIVLNSSHTFTGSGGLLSTMRMPVRPDQPLILGLNHLCQSGNLT